MNMSNVAIQLILHMCIVLSFGDFTPQDLQFPAFGYHCSNDRGLSPFRQNRRRLYSSSVCRRSPVLYSGPDDKIITETDNCVQGGASEYNSLPRLFVGKLSSTMDMVAAAKDDDLSPSEISQLQKNSRIKLSPEQSHYLTKVMRIFSKRRRRDVRVFDGVNGEWLCRVIELDHGGEKGNSKEMKRKGRQRRMRGKARGDNGESLLEVECIQMLRKQQANHPGMSTSKPWLFFAPIKKQRAKVMVEKCTELGAGLFFPVITENTDASAISACIVDDQRDNLSPVDAIMFQETNDNRGKSNGDLEKLSLISCEAAEQSEQLSVPAFITSHECVTSVEDLLQEWTRAESPLRNGRILMICRERTENRSNVNPILTAMENASIYNPSAAFAFFVGPEGGWSKSEEMMFDEYCTQHSDIIMGVSLGSNVLRAETAAMLAIGSCALRSSTMD